MKGAKYLLGLLVLISFGFCCTTCSRTNPYIYSGIKSEVVASSVEQDKIAFVKDVVDFTIKTYKMDKTKHYQVYVGKQNNKTLYILNVAKPFFLGAGRDNNFIPITRDQEFREFPLPYDYSYFQSRSDDTLEDERDFYLSKGQDVFWRSTTNYNSSYGSGSQITYNFINHSKLRQANVIAHEICHEWNAEHIGHGHGYNSNSDESECTVRGYFMAALYFQDRGTEEEADKALDSFINESIFAQLITGLISELRGIYNSQVDDATKLLMKNKALEDFQKSFGRKYNNAKLMDLLPYMVHFEKYLDFYLECGFAPGLQILKDSPEDEDGAVSFILKKTKECKLSDKNNS